MCEQCSSAALALKHERARFDFARWLVDTHRLCDHCRPPVANQPCGNAPALTRRLLAVSDDEMIHYAAPMGLSTDVVRRYVEVFGALPENYSDLCKWGNAHGYRDASGHWTI